MKRTLEFELAMQKRSEIMLLQSLHDGNIGGSSHPTKGHLNSASKHFQMMAVLYKQVCYPLFTQERNNHYHCHKHRI